MDSSSVAAAVRDGLGRSRKRLPPWLLYDRRGSALFEEITALPEYYPTRTERAILAAHAGEMIEAAGLPLSVIELGAGSAAKTRLLLEALLARQPQVLYRPIDVSPTALGLAAAELAPLERLVVEPLVARYPEDLDRLGTSAERRLVVFLGSNLGNFTPLEARRFLTSLRRRLAPGDALLVGVDLRKSARRLRAAYDDRRGVTAQFNKNVLTRLNRELDADFDLARFRHLVRWNPVASRIELYLESLAAQQVTIRGLGLRVRLREGERIHTESSYKPSVRRLACLFTSARLQLEQTWRDRRGWFGVHLLRVPAQRDRRAAH